MLARNTRNRRTNKYPLLFSSLVESSANLYASLSNLRAVCDCRHKRAFEIICTFWLIVAILRARLRRLRIGIVVYVAKCVSVSFRNRSNIWGRILHLQNTYKKHSFPVIISLKREVYSVIPVMQRNWCR